MSSLSHTSSAVSDDRRQDATTASSEAVRLLEYMEKTKGTAVGPSRSLVGTESESSLLDSPSRVPPIERADEPGKEPSDVVGSLKKEIETQDVIITALQKDNESLRSSFKKLQLHSREVEARLLNMEAKHSLMQSAAEAKPADSSVEVRKLMSENKELQKLLEEAQITALAAKAETRKLMSEVERTAALEAELRVVRKEAKDMVAVHDCEMQDLQKKLLEATEKVCKFKTDEGKNTSMTSIEQVVVEQQPQLVEQLRLRITELEKALSEQKTAMAVDSISSTKPEKRSTEDPLVQQLKQALNEKDVGMELMIERLRNEANVIRSSYEDKINRLRGQLAHARRHQEDPRQPQASTNLAHEEQEAKSAVELLTKEKQSLMDQLEALQVEVANYRKLAENRNENFQSTNAARERESSLFKNEYLQQLRELRLKHDEDIERLQKFHKDEMTRALEEIGDLKRAQKFLSQHGSLGNVCEISEEKEHAFLQNVVKRLAYLEMQNSQRERESAFEVAETKRLAKLQQRLLIEKYEMLLSQKNQQINQFRAELDDLLASVSCAKFASRT